MKGYKAFNEDLTCKGFQYKIGKEFKHEGEIDPCHAGFHFCKTLADCYRFYHPNDHTRICEIEALGAIKTNDNIKYVTNHIKIIKEIENTRELSNTGGNNSGFCNTGTSNSGNGNTGCVNSGNRNTGHNNSGDDNSGHRNYGDDNSGSHNDGDYNTGNWNSGDGNVGDQNSGDRNSGHYNTGSWNSGSKNSGRSNTGDGNSGDRNTGNWNYGSHNSGDFNRGDGNSGCFNTIVRPKITMFDQPSDWTMNDWKISEAYMVLRQIPVNRSKHINVDYMSDLEKEANYEYKTTGGYLKEITVSNVDRQKWWDELEVDKDRIFRSLPNFDEKKFCKCIGIDRF